MKRSIVFVLLFSCWALCAIQSGRLACGDEVDLAALQVDPDSDLGHWNRGQVHFDGQWRPIEAVQQLVATDPRWQEYRRLAENSDGSPVAHEELAYWCQKNGLEHEEKLHWLYVLQSNPNHRQAIDRLQLMHYQGQLYPIDQVVEFKEEAKAAKHAMLKYKPYFSKLRRAVEKGSETEREAALAAMADVSDPAAIPALLKVVKLELGNADEPPSKVVRKDEYSLEFALQRAAVAGLANISSHESTTRLLEIAVMSPYEMIRYAAAEALQQREKTSYVPMLMSCLAAPIEANVELDIMRDGAVLLTEQIEGKGPEANQFEMRSTNYLTVRYFQKQQRREVDHQLDWSNAVVRARQTMDLVARTNQSREQWNARIHEVLLTATGESLSDDPQEWWDYWKQYNELAYPDEPPTYTYYEQDEYVSYQTYPSCFVAETPVWTMKGAVPISMVKEGDLVLSQDPSTGCLDYRPVLQTTIRPPSPTVAVNVQDETIVATRGHRFWVLGKGWRMAKHLSAGDRLHGVRKTFYLETAEEAEEQEAYNLVVGEFHTYFVGNSKLLVHDNGCPVPTHAIAPGIKPQ